MNYSILSPTNGYWQCGQWSSTMTGATKYRDEAECNAVMHMRLLPDDCIVVRNTTPFRMVGKVAA